jgi:hypothetical protein
VVFDESVFPFSSPPTTTLDPDPSSLFPTNMVVQPPFRGLLHVLLHRGPCRVPVPPPRPPVIPRVRRPSALPRPLRLARIRGPRPLVLPRPLRLPWIRRRRPLVLPRHLLRGSLRRYGCTSVVRGRRRHLRSLLHRGHRHHRRSPCQPVSHRRSTTRRFFTDTRGMFTRW